MNCRYSCHREAQSLVEFAFVIPVLLLIFFGIFEFGMLLSVYVGLTNTAREAARAGATYQYQPPANPIGTPSLAAVDGQRAAAMNQMITATLHPMTDDGQLTIAYSYDPATPSANNYRYGEKVIVTLTYTHYFLIGIIAESITLQAQSEMRLEPGGR
jgi:Flp pilus assembly protein TadG